MIKANIEKLRDPFLIKDNDTYYLYGTGVKEGWNDSAWIGYKSKSLDGEWKAIEYDLALLPEDAQKQRWAPEVHKYNGSFYMIASYYSSKTGHRGCSVLKSGSPEGKFVEISDGHITPKNKDSIDGTLYIDADGQPWMVYVHEWTCTDDGVGRMSAAKLSDDLTHFIDEPIELFRADSPSWANDKVTDGCFMYTTKDKELLMIWSNFDSDNGYCVGFARSDNGRVDGHWSQDDELLYSKSLSGEEDGGHGMIFKDTGDSMYLVIHSPNSGVEKTLLIPVYEKNGTLVCEF